MLEMSQVICGVVGIPDSRIANVSSQNKTDYLTKSQYNFTELLHLTLIRSTARDYVQCPYNYVIL